MGAQDYPFLRQVELYISNVPEWQGGGSQAQMVKIVGDGTTNTLRIRFELRKHCMSTAAPSLIHVYNLSSQLRNTLAKIAGKKEGGSEIELKIGWQNTRVMTVFSGSLLACYSERQGPDIVTTLVSLAEFGSMVRTVISQTFNAGATLVSMIKSIAGQIPSVTIGQINVTDVTIGNQGWSHWGAAKNCLDRLARIYGFHYWFDNGVFHACDDAKVLSESAIPLVSYKNGRLKRVEPILTTPFQQFSGVTVQALIDPNVLVGGSVQVESKINPSLNNRYQVTTLTMTGDTHSNEWDMRIESLYWPGGQMIYTGGGA
jgi:hypothetical protein